MEILAPYRKRFDELVANCKNDINSSDVFRDFSQLCWTGELHDKNVLWSNGCVFLTPSAAIADEIANWLDELGFCACTGYYDPEDDKRYDCVDECTGFYYTDI